MLPKAKTLSLYCIRFQMLELVVLFLTTTSLVTSFSSTTSKFTVQRVTGDSDQIANICTFRNNLISPQMVIDNQIRKNCEFDKTKSLIEGVGQGLVAGLVVGSFEAAQSSNIMSGLKIAATLGLPVAALLGGRNFFSDRVFVFSLPQAENRLFVDFSGSLPNGDVGFIAKVSPEGIFNSTGGICGVVDAQIREQGNYGELPKHLHLKNMEVHDSMRRRGAAKSLISNVFEFAKEEQINTITLIVDNNNIQAISLYEKNGFKIEPLNKAKHGTSTRARSIMIKNI